MPPFISVADLRAPSPPDPTRLLPPPRFKNVSFANYRPQHPSQSEARSRLQEFVIARHGAGRDHAAGAVAVAVAGAGAGAGAVAEAATGAGRAGRRARRSWSRPTWLGGEQPKRSGAGIYLDGGFGVGKTHLLAAAFAEADTPAKRYLTFQELVYLIGTMGRREAEAQLASSALICIDEFELDDPGNILIVKSFLAALFAAGGSVVTTSNTPPDAQGQGRFNAQDFQREIQSVAERFEVVSVGGPDYRRRAPSSGWLDKAQMSRLEAESSGPPPRLRLDFSELESLLAEVHPSRYGGLVSQVGTVFLHDVTTIPDQNRALRFVHFIDKLYDSAVALRATGADDKPLAELFDPSYRNSAYHKKHDRCLSRIGELLAEAHDPQPVA